MKSIELSIISSISLTFSTLFSHSKKSNLETKICGINQLLAKEDIVDANLGRACHCKDTKLWLMTLVQNTYLLLVKRWHCIIVLPVIAKIQFYDWWHHEDIFNLKCFQNNNEGHIRDSVNVQFYIHTCQKDMPTSARFCTYVGTGRIVRSCLNFFEC